MREEFSHQDILNCINDAVIVTRGTPLDGDGPQIVYVNPAFTALTGYTADEVIGKSPHLLQGPDTDPATRSEIRKALVQRTPIHTEILNYSKSGQPYWVDLKILPLEDAEGNITHFAAISKDLTESKRLQHELHHLAHKDVLTGITNGEHFMLLAESEFYRSRRYRRPLAVIRFDLENYRLLLRTHGQLAADEALKAAAENCRTLLRQSDICSRIGGEKFALLLPETGIEAAEELAERLCMLLCVIQVKHKTGELAISANFGVTITADSDNSLFDVLERADSALDDARHSGSNKVKTRITNNVRYLNSY